MISNFSTETQTITPEMAAEILKRNNFLLQRRIKGTHVINIKNAMEKNCFPAGTQLNFAIFDDQIFLLDGQHRLHAQSQINEPIDYTITKYTVDGIEDVAELYCQLDQGAKRTNNDRLVALGIEDQFSNISKTMLMKVANSMPYILNGFKKVRPKDISDISPQERIDAIRKFEIGAEKWCEELKDAEPLLKKILTRPTIMAFGLYTYQFSPDLAAKFWKPIMKMAVTDNDEIGCPIRAAYKYLLNTDLKVGLNHSVSMAQTLIRCWNVHVDGGKLKHKRKNGSVVTLAPAENIEIHFEKYKTIDSLMNKYSY